MGELRRLVAIVAQQLVTILPTGFSLSLIDVSVEADAAAAAAVCKHVSGINPG